jgi:hypothetical protein
MFGDSFTYFPKIAHLIFSADSFGYIASFLVLATFSMRRMVPLRIVAILSNIAFFEYGFNLGLKPVALLHGLLLPINICRLAQAYEVDIPEAISKLFRSVVAVRSPVIHFARVSAISALLITGANSSTEDADPLSASVGCGPLGCSQSTGAFITAQPNKLPMSRLSYPDAHVRGPAFPEATSP